MVQMYSFIPIKKKFNINLHSQPKYGFSPFSIGARGVVVIAVGNEHGDTSSNPGRYWLHFT